MADNAGTLERIVHELAIALQPLEKHLASGNAEGFLHSIGLALPAPVLADGQLVSALAATAASAADLAPLIAELTAAINADDTAQIIKAGSALVIKIGQLVSTLNQIGPALSSAAATAGLSGPQLTQVQAFAGELARKLFDYTVVEYLRGKARGVLPTLTVMGLIDDTDMPGDPSDPLQPPYRLEALHLDRLTTLFVDPATYLREAFGFGDVNFDSSQLFAKIRGFLDDADLPVTIITPSGQPPILEAYLFRISVDPASSPPALTFRLRIPATQDFSQAYTLNDIWQFLLSAKARFDSGLDGVVVPPLSVTMHPPSGSVSIDLEGGFGAQRPGGTVVLISESAGTKLEAAKIAVTMGFVGALTSSGAATGEPSVSGRFNGGKLTIDTSNSDGFISKILSDTQVEATFDFAASWQPSTGLHFHGSGGIELETALAISLGPVNIDRLHIGLGLDSTGGFTFELSMGLNAAFGPVQASIERIGASGRLTFPTDGGNLGRADFAIGFKPPTGLGIAIDAGPVTGGGFIEFDPDNGRYTGVLALSLYSIQVKAIGLLDTKLPGGESGYSFLVIISVEFTPIQLGFGFTLNGVGGLCGINRNFVTEAIQAGLRQHSLDHILFPRDPVKNAPAIVSDLRAIFPPIEGRYVFGPMLELGWGGGLNLVTAELGVILSIPSPVVIAILGQFNVNLPNPDAPVVVLHLDVLGVIDFGKKLFSLDASLHDSRIVVFTIYGDMAMRLSWGDNPNFALSIGGLNPHYQPPPGFPVLKRLTLALSATDNFRLTIQTYFAITSNTFQLGAHAELYIGVSAFNVYGWLGFDALIIFTPFSFIVDFTAGLALRSGTSTLLGISLDGQLSGPTPWHAKGNAHVTIIFFEISVHVDITWGESRQISAPQTDAWPQLRDAIANVANWSGALPPSVPSVVTLAKPPSDTTTVLVDPNGVLTMRERVLPLNQTLTKFGEAVPGPQNTFTLDHISLGGQSAPFAIVRDKFAPAQFEAMSDQDKLSRPSFEDRVAGFTVGDGQISVGTSFGRDIAFEDIYIDDKAPPPTPIRFNPTLLLQLLWALSNAAANSALRVLAMGKYAPPPTAAQLITLQEERFVVATTNTLAQRTDITSPVSKGEAYQALAAHLSTHPDARGQLQIVPLFEVTS